MNDASPGTRFSLNYLPRGAPEKDSRRARRRLLRAFGDAESNSFAFSVELEREIGVDVPCGYHGPLWEAYFENVPLRDLLDTVTVVFAVLRKKQLGFKAITWREACRRIFKEENLGYRVDDEGGVHFAVDEAFEGNRVSVIAELGQPRFDAARAAVEAAHNALDGQPPDTRSAFRSIFDANEIVFRLILGKSVSRLGASEIQKHLKPLVLTFYEGAARDAANQMVNGFAAWVNAVHQYRHAKGVEQPEEPPADLTILGLSVGSSYVRWLVQLDRRFAQQTAA